MRTGLHLSARVLAIGASVVMMLAVTIVGVRFLKERQGPADHPPASHMASPGPPIPAEARPFQPGPTRWDREAAQARVPIAHPRTLEFSRRVRAYPGAPPRIPHGLTADEFRLGTCNTCHAQGGFSPRFGAYAPVTPHPEMTDCMQCHVPDVRVVGIASTPPREDAICLQCHVDPDAPAPRFVTLDWVPMTWPETGQRAMPEGPPWIPHPLHMRENCVACHGGAGAVQEIRTTHPQRTDCRSCHVTTHADQGFVRNPTGSVPERGGIR